MRGTRYPARRSLVALMGACVLSVTLAPPVGAATQTTGRLLVTFESGVAGGPKAQASAVRSVLRRAGGRQARPGLPQIDTEVLRPPAGTGLRTFAATLRALPGVERVEVERRHELRYVPNDPSVGTPEPRATAPDTSLQWWAGRTGLFAAWDVTRGADARVAIIDTGVDGKHPDLAGQILRAVDDDASGTGTATTDEIGHGTHVASLACAAGDNGIGLVGAGFGCKLLIYKTDLSDSSVARSIIAATDAGAQAINMSFGTDGSQPAARAIVDAIDYAVKRDVVLVAAAADEPVQEQGDPSNVLQPTGSGADITAGRGLSVTAANFADRRASFAGLGSQISLAAYGAYNVSGGPPRPVRGVPGADDVLGTRRDLPARVWLPDRARRGSSLRLPAGHVDGRSDRGCHRGAGARSQPRYLGPRSRPTAQADREPSRRHRLDAGPRLGDPRTPVPPSTSPARLTSVRRPRSSGDRPSRRRGGSRCAGRPRTRPPSP